MKLSKESKTSFSLNMKKEILNKVRGIVDTIPAETVTSYIQSALEEKIKIYEETYGEIDEVRDMYFDAPKRRTHSI